MEEATFRREVRRWLDAHVPRREPSAEPSPLLTTTTAADLPKARRLQGALFEAGLAGISWPKEHGGRGGTLVEEVIFQQEAARYELPVEFFVIGAALVGPTVIVHGTPAQQQRYLLPILRGDEVWCQLFSEPAAGSDLAGLTTRAVRDGDEWVVSGQKVWNSGAQWSDWGILPARTDPTQPKHKGISYFLVDMHAPGVTVRPLRQISGRSHFCEVFLDDVRVPMSQLVGQVNGGWSVTQTTLMNERMMMGRGRAASIEPSQLITLARSRRRNGHVASLDPVLRQRIIDVHIRSELLRFLGYRSLTSLKKGAAPGPEGSIGKLFLGQLARRANDLALAVLGAEAMVADGSSIGGAWQESFLSGPMLRIAGGTDEIQRNIIAERVLGLPREHDEGRTSPFSERPRPTEAR